MRLDDVTGAQQGHPGERLTTGGAGKAQHEGEAVDAESRQPRRQHVDHFRHGAARREHPVQVVDLGEAVPVRQGTHAALSALHTRRAP